jgi:hypothetical protein
MLSAPEGEPGFLDRECMLPQPGGVGNAAKERLNAPLDGRNGRAPAAQRTVKERLGFLVPYARRRDAEGYAKVDCDPETARKE